MARLFKLFRYQRPLSVEHKSAAIGEWLKILLLTNDFDLVRNPAQYAQLKASIHIIWGNQDTITPPWQAEAVKVMFKNSNIKMMEKVGHIPMIENSKEFSKLMLEIFKK